MASGGIQNFANFVIFFTVLVMLFWCFFFYPGHVSAKQRFPKILHCREMDAIYEGFIITFLHVFTKMVLRTFASLKTVYSESKCNYPVKVSVWVCSPAISEFCRSLLF